MNYEIREYYRTKDKLQIKKNGHDIVWHSYNYYETLNEAVCDMELLKITFKNISDVAILYYESEPSSEIIEQRVNKGQIVFCIVKLNK